MLQFQSLIPVLNFRNSQMETVCEGTSKRQYLSSGELIHYLLVYFAGHQLGRVGGYHVLRSRHTLVLGLGVFCHAYCGKCFFLAKNKFFCEFFEIFSIFAGLLMMSRLMPMLLNRQIIILCTFAPESALNLNFLDIVP